MKIVIISDWFAEETGYAENMLPKSMAKLGHHVILITSNGKPYFTHPDYKTVYGSFLGEPIVECSVRELNGVTVYRLPHSIRRRGQIWIDGLYRTIRKLRPDIVQTFEVTNLTTLWAAFWSVWLGYRFFAESRLHASVFKPLNLKNGESRNYLYRRVLEIYAQNGWPHLGSRMLLKMRGIPMSVFDKFLSIIAMNRTIRCYALSEDVKEILIQHFGWPSSKVAICPLGTDTELFTPRSDTGSDETERKIRLRLGFSENDIVCIYTGRFTQDKDPLCLALAIDKLFSSGKPVRGLFVGHGEETYVKKILQCRGCVVHPFVSHVELPTLYRASDIGVWPRQESTSQLDAMACGLPLILSDRVRCHERIDGNAATYREGDFHSLALTISSMLDAERRKNLSEIGLRKVRSHLSWDAIAASRIKDYMTLSGHSTD
jgi:glycosyltransferase involved in cell wall biosynthesis